MTTRRANGEGTKVLRHKSGRHFAQLTVHGKRVTVYGADPQEVRVKLTELLAQNNRGTLPAPDRTTVAEFVTSWLDRRGRRLAPKTLSSYRYLINKYVLPSLGSTRLQALKPVDLAAFYDRLAKKSLSARTQKYVAGLIFSVLKDAVKLELVTRNVADGIRPETARQERIAKVWTGKEAAQFLGVAHDDRLHLAFYLMLALGLRKGEVLGLRWENVDLKKGILIVSQTIVSLEGKPIVSAPKTANSRRTLFLSPDVVALLAAHRVLQAVEQAHHGGAWMESGLVIATRTGTPVDPNNVGRSLDRIAKAAGVPRLRVHDLRHTHASLALKAGTPVEVVSSTLGHARPGFTMEVYRHLYESERRRAALPLSELLGLEGDLEEGG